MIVPCTEGLATEIPSAERMRTPSIEPTIELPISANDLLIRPNPSSGNTTIQFNLTQPSIIDLEVFNPQGKLVDRLIRSEAHLEGEYELNYLPSKLSYGVYHIVLKKDQQVITKKLVIIR